MDCVRDNNIEKRAVEGDLMGKRAKEKDVAPINHRGKREAKEALNNKAKEDENDDDVLDKVLYHLGGMGRYQKFLFICMMPVGFFFAFIYFVQMFIAATPQHHWCRIPELAHLDIELRRNLSAPGAAAGGEWDKCSTYDTNWTRVLETMTPPDPNTTTIPCQYGWDFDLVDIPYSTVVSERGWVCEYSGNVPIAQALFFVGAVVGGIFFGWMADRYGRVPAFTVSNIMGIIGGIATVFTTGLWDFSLARFTVGLAFDSGFMMFYILMLEYVGPKYRSGVGTLSTAIFFGGGCVALPWLALWVANWRTLVWVTTLPMIMVLFAPWTVPESVRWLMSRGRVNQSVQILKKFEKVNRKKIPEELFEEFIVVSGKTKHSQDSILTVLRSGPLRFVVLVMMFVYMCSAIIFDGLVRMSDNLGLDFFITFTLASVTEVISVSLLAIVLDRWGRRVLGCLPLIITGIFMLVGMFTPKGIPQATFAIMARFFINMSYITIVQWTMELLPTGVRALGSNSLHVAGYFATVFSPFIVYSERFWSGLPLLFLGVASLLAGGANIMLPETRGRSMPQTMEDGERLFREHSVCGNPEKEDVEIPQWRAEKERAFIT